MPIDPLPEDADVLRAMVHELTEENRRLSHQNDKLRHVLKQLQNAQFGKRSERLGRPDRDQLLLAIEDIETSAAKQEAEEENNPPTEQPANSSAPQKRKRRINRGALPTCLPRMHQTLEPESVVCPCCNGNMHVIGEDISERLDIIPAQYRVIVTHRPRLSGLRECRGPGPGAGSTDQKWHPHRGPGSCGACR